MLKPELFKVLNSVFCKILATVSFHALDHENSHHRTSRTLASQRYTEMQRPYIVSKEACQTELTTHAELQGTGQHPQGS